MRYWDYLTTIYRLNEAGVEARLKNIAAELDVKAPTAHRVLARLEREGYVEKRGHMYVLTLKGLEIASQIVKRHRIIERLLTDVLNLSLLESHFLAHELEHAANFSERVDQYLGRPSTCPHGNPVPGRAAPLGEVPLAQASSGEYMVSRIAEVGASLRFAAETGLGAGELVKVVGRGEDAVDVEVGSRRLSLPLEVAKLIYIKVVG